MCRGDSLQEVIQKTSVPRRKGIWLLVCSIPEDDSAHMRTRFPGYQALCKRNVKGGGEVCIVEKREKNKHAHIKPCFLSSLLLINTFF